MRVSHAGCVRLDRSDNIFPPISSSLYGVYSLLDTTNWAEVGWPARLAVAGQFISQSPVVIAALALTCWPAASWPLVCYPRPATAGCCEVLQVVFCRSPLPSKSRSAHIQGGYQTRPLFPGHICGMLWSFDLGGQQTPHQIFHAERYNP